MSNSIQVALFSHDSVGLGHASRNRSLAFSLARDLPRLLGPEYRDREVGGLLIAGNPLAAQFSLPPGWDWVILPGVEHSRLGYIPRRFSASMSGLRRLRSAAIKAILEAQQPDLFIADRHPFGIESELTESLEILRAQGCRTVLGLREVLDSPEVLDREWDRIGGPGAVAAAFDAVWIYGDSAVYDPRMTGEVPSEIAHLATSTGYLSLDRPEPVRRPDERAPQIAEPFVLTLLGGGADGGDLARHAVRSTPPAGHSHLVVTGPQMPEHERDFLSTISDPATTIVKHSTEVPTLIDRAEAVVCMGGYNTLAEVMATSTPALVVPRAKRREEQPRRARALAAAGAVDTIELKALTPQTLSSWWKDNAGLPVSRDHINRSGLAMVPRLAAQLLAAPRSAPDYGFGAAVGGPVPAAHAHRNDVPGQEAHYVG